MIRATGAKLRILASDSTFPALEARRAVSGAGDDEAWDMIGRVTSRTTTPVFFRLRFGGAQ